MINDLEMKYKKLKQEYDKLDGIIDVNNAKIGQLEKENERLKHSEKDLSRICQGFKRDIETEKSSKIKYYQTLQEIKEIAENWRNNDWSCFKCRSNMDERLNEILQKIAECEVE